MWFSLHENRARGAQVLFYHLAPEGLRLPPNPIWGCPGDRFFVKNRARRTCALRLRTLAPKVTRSRPRDPQGRQSEARKLTFRGPGASIWVKIRDSGPLREP